MKPLLYYIFIVAIIPGMLIGVQTQESKINFTDHGGTQTYLSMRYPGYEKEFLLGHYDPATYPNFSKAYRFCKEGNIYLLDEVYDAFIEMAEAAQKDNIHLNIISACRNFNHQKALWEAKISQLSAGLFQFLDPLRQKQIVELALQFTAMPGTSRHHWGTDLDLNSSDPNFYDSDAGIKIYNWLLANAADFGFRQVYSAHQDRSGHDVEPWHWSYYRLSIPMYFNYIDKIKNSDIKGFSGDAYLSELHIIPMYVSGINPEMK
ncbi:MAG: M15 family metallopeptidase [Candidatus Cloacimonetes bacterium]|nr:M15 family metallopeptidase [Candidatus Cloacimonadota bacterium]